MIMKFYISRWSLCSSCLSRKTSLKYCHCFKETQIRVFIHWSGFIKLFCPIDIGFFSMKLTHSLSASVCIIQMLSPALCRSVGRFKAFTDEQNRSTLLINYDTHESEMLHIPSRGTVIVSHFSQSHDWKCCAHILNTLCISFVLVEISSKSDSLQRRFKDAFYPSYA